MLGWLTELALALSNIFSHDTKFPNYGLMIMALTTLAKPKTDTEHEERKLARNIIARAKKYFYHLPASFDPHNASLLAAIDKIFVGTIMKCAATANWRPLMSEYMFQVAKVFHTTYPEGKEPVLDTPGRAGARAAFYFYELSLIHI